MDCIAKFVVLYFDDILVYSRSVESHLQHLREVLLVLRKLICSLMQKNVHFM